MDLIKSEICAVPFDCNGELDESILNSLYTLSKKHDMTQIIVSPLEKMSVLKPEYAVTEKYKKALFTAIYRYEKSNYDLNQICDLFSKEGIDHMPLKGAVIRKFYPKPYLRTSCDLDVLVKEEDLDRAAALLVEKLGYVRGDKGQHDVSMITPSGGHLELHFTLVESGFKDSKELQTIWQNSEIIEVSPHRYEMTPEMFLFFHVYHTAKHFVHGGCGIKPVIDLWILKNKIGYDETKAEAMLESNGLIAFYRGISDLSNVWFGNQNHTAKTQEIEDYILKGGVYGTFEQNIAMSQSKKGGRLGHILSRIFVSYDTLAVLYPSLKKIPFLFPIYQVRRWFRVLSPAKRRRAMNEIKLSQSISETKKDKAKNLLNELGL